MEHLRVGPVEVVVSVVLAVPSRGGRTRVVRPLAGGYGVERARLCVSVWVMDVVEAFVSRWGPSVWRWATTVVRYPVHVVTGSVVCSEVATEGGTGLCEARVREPGGLQVELLPHAQ